MRNPLGEKISFPQKFDPSLLYSIPRSESRAKLKIEGKPPFSGFDLWRCYELYWLNAVGVPQVGVLLLTIPSDTSHLVESKSLKLFLGSLNGERFPTPDKLKDEITLHLSRVIKTVSFSVEILLAPEWNDLSPAPPRGSSIDGENLQVVRLEYSPKLLNASAQQATESLHSNLLRSICPVTGQPDYATLFLSYSGPQLDRQALLSYVASLSRHKGFHEDLCELIFMDIFRTLRPTELLVQCSFTRRGGIEINPIRFTPGFDIQPVVRQLRQ